MKIVWVSPYNDQSAIARMSAAVVTELARLGHDVTVVRSESENIRYKSLTAPGRIIHWTDRIDWDSFDITVINFGDSFPFHEGCIAVTEQTKALGIFHDWFVIHLFIAWARTAGLSDVKMQDLLTRIHGSTAYEEFRDTPEENWVRMDKPPISMMGWLAERLDGAIAHSQFYTGDLKTHCPGPIAHLPLPMPVRLLPSPEPKPEGAELEILTFGFLHPNKRVEAVLRALGKIKGEVGPFIYRAVGSIADDERSKLTQLAQKLQIDFRLEGRASDAELDRFLAQADIVCCLRYPALEGASGSLIEAMNAGKATIVTNTGCYAEIPEGYTLKVRPEAEQNDLQHHLKILMTQPSRRKDLGAAAARWSLDRFNITHYTAALVRHCAAVLASQPILRAAEKLGAEAGKMGIPPQSSFLLHLEKQMNSLWPDHG